MTQETPAAVARQSDEKLVRHLFREADQLRIDVAREAVSRGQRIVPLLADVLRHEYNWYRADAGWCAVVHATFLLGAIGEDCVIEPLMDALRLAETFEEDWIVGELPSIFGRLGPSALEPLRRIGAIPGGDWMLRHTALSCTAAVALRFPAEEADVFRLIAIVAGDEREDEDIRVWAGKILLDFGRAEHRDLLLRLVDSGKAKPLYGRSAVTRGLQWPNVACYSRDWMRFYDEDQIAKRRQEAERERLAEPEAWSLALSVPWGADPECPGEPPGSPYDEPDEEAVGLENALALPNEERETEDYRNKARLRGRKFKKLLASRPAGRA